MKQHHLSYLLVVLLFLTASAEPSLAASARDLVARGNAAYHAGKYDEALSAYDQAAKEKPADAWIEFNKGAAFFRKGDLDKAKDAWEKAALGAVDLPLEAKSLYNLGNLEYSKLAKAQAADPKAALDAGDRSVRYYQEAKSLLEKSPTEKNNPLVRDASENIEVVRRTMKTIKEEMDKREEAARNQQQAAKDLKNLIDRQQNLNQQTQAQASGAPQTKPENQDKNKPEAGKPNQAETDKMAKEQAQLQEETKKTAEKLGQTDTPSPATQQSTPDPAEAAQDHLKEAQARQQAAAEKLSAGNASQALQDQKNALEKMKNALDLLQYKENQKSQGQDQKQQDQAKQKQSGKEAGKKGPSEQKQEPQPQQASAGKMENQPEPKTDKTGIGLPDDARQILGEEKENKKIRQQVGAGGYQDVDKDW